ncbi:MAG: cell division protein ZapB [Oxalobacter sp.]|nr:cell division protein ZapB [Oxalobacter sp.]
MISELDLLAEKINGLVTLTQTLKQENASLKAQAESLRQEKQQLLERMETARQKVAAIIERLPAETGGDAA